MHAASPRQPSSRRLGKGSSRPPSDMDMDDKEIMLDCCKASISRGTEAPPPPSPTSPPLHSIRASSIARRRLADAWGGGAGADQASGKEGGVIVLQISQVG